MDSKKKRKSLIHIRFERSIALKRAKFGLSDLNRAKHWQQLMDQDYHHRWQTCYKEQGGQIVASGSNLRGKISTTRRHTCEQRKRNAVITLLTISNDGETDWIVKKILIFQLLRNFQCLWWKNVCTRLENFAFKFSRMGALQHYNCNKYFTCQISERLGNPKVMKVEGQTCKSFDIESCACSWASRSQN